MIKRIPISLLIVAVLPILLLAGCQAPEPASLSNDQVVQSVENILKAIDEGDYQSFRLDFSDGMKDAFPEAQFTSLAGLLGNASGKYVSCADTEPQLSNNQGYAVYRIACAYELESVMVTVTFKVGGDQVEGLLFDSTNLRKISQ